LMFDTADLPMLVAAAPAADAAMALIDFADGVSCQPTC